MSGEVISSGYVGDCKLCCGSYLRGSFIMGADYCVMEFSVVTRCMRLVISFCKVSRMLLIGVVGSN